MTGNALLVSNHSLQGLSKFYFKNGMGSVVRSCLRSRFSTLTLRQSKLEQVRNQKGELFTLSRENEKLIEYYQAQKICSSEEEWGQCLSAMRRDLPQAFRLNESHHRRHEVEKIKSLLLQGVFNQGSAAIKPIGDGHHSWQINRSRWELKCETAPPELKKIAAFILNEDNLGTLSRQELVSQVPVRCLDIKPGHSVLDLCAAPGSKTKQVVEALHAVDDGGAGATPDGFVVANEVNVGRCFRLVNQVKKLSSPCVIFVNHDGGRFPDTYVTLDNGKKKKIRYDRIVCDQPCSGDGTIRKNPDIWLNWSPAGGNWMHLLQYDIAKRGLELLKVGGLFAYSSCAMNPVENEAVLNQLLAESNGSFEILDVSARVRDMGLKSKDGLEHWLVFDHEMNAFERMDQLSKSDRKSKSQKEIVASMFPVENEYSRQLRHCRRFLPHLNDDGGFFVAILKKNRIMPWENKKYRPRTTNKIGLKLSPKESKKPGCFPKLWRSRQSLTFLEDKMDMTPIYDFPTKLLYSTKARNNLYYVSSAVKNLILSNYGKKFNMYAAGVLCFEKNHRKTNSENFQISRNNSLLALSLMDAKRQIGLSRNQFEKLLHSATTRKAVPFELLFETEQEKEPFLALSKNPGSVKITVEKDNLNYLGYVGRSTLLLDISAEQRNHCLNIIKEFRLDHF